MTTPVPITVARGDGIGPEIMAATLKILDAAGAKLKIEEIDVGEAVYKRGISSGIEESSWASLYKTKVFLKSPITTPQGGGYKSLNVTCRKTLGLYANVRQCVSYHPFVDTHFPKMDMVIVRENEEDLYAGIEYQRTPDVMVGLKVITRQGSEKIIRYAFEYARSNGRKKVTCMSKDNIMKMCDGLFHKTFEAIAAEYPDIQNEHYIVDIGAARIASRPQDFDVVVTENLYGDILSDIAAEITGSVGLGGSCNIGPDVSMFEAVHGSAPDIAGKGLANPSGLVLASIMMLTHIGQNDVATRLHNAWLKTIEDGIHTGDIYQEGTSTKRVGTDEFTSAVIARLGQKPVKLTAVDYGTGGAERVNIKTRPHDTTTVKKRIGADVFVAWTGTVPSKLADLVLPALPTGFSLKMLTNRGLKAWPGTAPTSAFSSLWALRILADKVDTQGLSAGQIASLHDLLAGSGLDISAVETLFNYDDKPGFTAAQGE